MWFFDVWQLWQALYRDGGLLIITMDAQQVGIRTLLQLDGDMVTSVPTPGIVQEDVAQRHAAVVVQKLRTLRRLGQALQRFGSLHVSMGWHIAGLLAVYGRELYQQRASLVGSVLLSLVLAAGWGLQRLLPRWLGATHDRWVALVLATGPLWTCVLLWLTQGWVCAWVPYVVCEAITSILPSLVGAGILGVVRLLYKSSMRWYLRRALGMG